MIIILYVIPLIFLNCQREQPSQLSLFAPDNQYIQHTGRIDFTNPKRPRLSGAGTYFQVKFKGSTCDILLEDQNLYNNHNYLSIAIDGICIGRIKVSKDKTIYQIARNLTDSDHNLLVCKATESQIGYVEFLGILCNEILPLEKKKKRKIEFIGNKIR